jgi:hypothetical protein
MICRSRVSINAEHPAAFARSIKRSTKSRSRITYSWNQNGAGDCAATSSIEQMLIVDSVNGTPNAAAARAARISPSAHCIPVSPVGASATGIATSWPIIWVRSERCSRSIATRWRSFKRARSALFAR